MAEQTLTVRLRADGQGLVGTVRVSDRQLQRLERQFERTGGRARRFGSDVQRAERPVNRLGDSVNRVRGLVAGLGVALGARQVVRASDSYRNINAQLELVGLNYENVNRVAQETFGTIEATSRVAFRLGAQTDLHSQRILQLTETINQAFAVSGATQQEASNSIFQLTQGLAAGALRGEEFNSVMEQAPRLVRALTDHLGKTTGELREMAHAGELTTEVIVEALTAQAGAIRQEFASVPLTVQRAMTQIKNSFVEAIGESSEVQRSTQSLADGLSTLATHLPTVIQYTIQATKVLLGLAAARFLGPMFQTIGTGALFAAESIRVLGVRGAAAYAQLSLLGKSGAALSRGLALIGGPLGVATAAVIGLTAAYRNQQGELEELAQISPETAQAVEAANVTMSRSSQEMVNQTRQALQQVREEMRQTAQEQERLAAANRQRSTGAAGASDLAGLGAGQRAAELQAVEDRMSSLRSEASQLGLQLAALESPLGTVFDLVRMGKEAWDQTNDEFVRANREVPQIIERVESLTQKLQDQRVEQEKGRVALLKLQRARDLQVAVTEEQRDRINEVYDALIQETRATQDLEDAQNTANEARKTAIQLAKEHQQAEEDLADRLQDVIDRLDPGAAQLREFTRMEQTLTEAFHAGELGLAEYHQRLSEVEQLRRESIETSNEFGRAGEEAGERFGAGMSAAQQHAREFQGYFFNLADSLSSAFGDFVTRSIKSFSDLGDQLKRIGQRFLSDLVAMFLRNRIILPITMAMMPGMAGAGGMGGLGGIMGMFGGGGAGGGGMGGMLSGMTSLMGAAGGLGSGGFAGMLGMGGLGGGIFNAGMGIGGSFGGGLMSAGMGMAQGGLLSGMFGSSGLMGGIGQVFGGNILGGLGMAIPAIGAIAGLATLVNSVSGGRLFGTDYETTGQARQLSFGAGGATGQLETQQEKERSLFRGTARRTLTEDLDAETQQAIQQFFDQLTASVESASEALGVAMPSLIEGTFREVLDAEGNLESTTATIGGRTYDDITQEEFQQRLVAENLIAVVSAANEAADAIAERWRANAETLMEGAQLLLTVQQQIQAGNALLEGDNALRNIVDLVEELQGAGETLSQSYQRLVQSTALYEDALDLMGQAFDGGREDLVRHAAAIADAAGGLERATQLWQSFFSTFYSGIERGEAALARGQQAAGEQLGDVGLSGDIGREAFREAFEQAMATDLSAEATAEWLEAADALAQVLNLEEQLSDQRRELTRFMQDVTIAAGQAAGTISDFDVALIDVQRQIEDQIERAEELGASEAQLADIRAAGQVLINDVMDQWRERQADFMRGINDELAQLTGTGSDFQRELRDIARAFNDAMAEGRALGLSTQQLANVQALAQARMEAAAAQLESNIRDLVGQLYGTPLEQLDEEIAAIREQYAGGSEHARIVEQHRLEPLLAERERLAEQQRAAERIDLAQGLAQGVADLAGVRGNNDFAALADEFGFTLADLAGDLGIDQSRLNDYLADLQAASYTLEDLTGGIDDILGPQVDRIVNAITGQVDGREVGTKPVTGEDTGKGGQAETVEVDTNAGTTTLELPVRAHEREMLTTLKQAATELNNILKAARDGKKVDENGYSAIENRLGEIHRTLNRDDKTGRRGRGGTK